MVEKGGNFGWSIREGTMLFGKSVRPPADPLVPPAWKYDHRVGLSITGGRVYRGSNVAELVGKYLYADFIANTIWALDFDSDSHEIKANYRVGRSDRPAVGFGQDAAGEVYCLVVDGNGKCIFRFVPQGE